MRQYTYYILIRTSFRTVTHWVCHVLYF